MVKLGSISMYVRHHCCSGTYAVQCAAAHSHAASGAAGDSDESIHSSKEEVGRKMMQGATPSVGDQSATSREICCSCCGQQDTISIYVLALEPAPFLARVPTRHAKTLCTRRAGAQKVVSLVGADIELFCYSWSPDLDRQKEDTSETTHVQRISCAAEQETTSAGECIP